MDAVIKIIGQLSAAENLLHVFPSGKKMADFCTQALKKIPGVACCSICICEDNGPKGDGDRVSEFCKNCDIGSRSFGFNEATVCRYAGRTGHEIFSLQTPAVFFGYLILDIADPDRFSNYFPFVSNFANAMTIHMENLWQKAQLQTKNRELESYRDRLELQVKERTEQLEKSEHLLDITQKMAKVGGWEWDVIDQTLAWTAETFRIHGLDPDSHGPCSIEDSLKCYDPEDQPKIWETFQRCIKEKKSYDMQFCITTYQNDRVWVRTMGWPVLKNGQVIKVIGNIKDISDYKKLEEERVALTKQLQHAQKADSLARMAGAIAHHYNNQLNVVMGNLELAMADIPGDAVYYDNLAAAMQAARRSAEISAEMLTYLGHSQEKISRVNLTGICLSYLPILQISLPANIDLETDFLTEGPVVLANGNQVRMILTQLAANALEAIGDLGGRIGLSTEVIPLSGMPVRVTAPADWHPRAGRYACLTVTDTGTGIVEAHMEKLFDPFFSTKFTGRGLGLPMVLGVLKSWEGAVNIESRHNRGTAVHVYIPIQEKSSADQPDIDDPNGLSIETDPV